MLYVSLTLLPMASACILTESTLLLPEPTLSVWLARIIGNSCPLFKNIFGVFLWHSRLRIWGFHCSCSDNCCCVCLSLAQELSHDMGAAPQKRKTSRDTQLTEATREQNHRTTQELLCSRYIIAEAFARTQVPVGYVSAWTGCVH